MSYGNEWSRCVARERSRQAIETAARRRLLVALRRQRRAERAASRARSAWLAVPAGTPSVPAQHVPASAAGRVG